ncbi:programmed cell death 1 ligand 1-like [Pelmatolapia mariae]|uniref:programmed cell death 1 ligand 1-like n=1 Tax=Pelmatolapia mariae TaxID=158779 RepID=UPI002FE66D39
MSRRRSFLFFSTFLFVDLFMFVSADQKNITAKSGENITLPCRPSNINVSIIVVKWSRDYLGNEYVLLYRGGQFVPDHQHPSFKNRVDLQDRQMKDGDVSLILKDVTINDTGTYECQVIPRGGNNLMPINNITLRVVPPGQTGGHTKDGSVGLIVALCVSAVLLVVAVVVGFVIYRKHRCKQKSKIPAEQQ